MHAPVFNKKRGGEIAGAGVRKDALVGVKLHAGRGVVDLEVPGFAPHGVGRCEMEAVAGGVESDQREAGHRVNSCAAILDDGLGEDFRDVKDARRLTFRRDGFYAVLEHRHAERATDGYGVGSG